MTEKQAWRSFAEALAALDANALPSQNRRRLAQLWAERGRNEHASVASFGRFALALMALGAPPELIEAAHRAALDEIRHARLAISLASAYGDEPMGFGALRVDGAFDDLDSLEAMAIATVVEGCIGETLSAIEAATAAAQAGPRAVRVALEVIARDEARHAELAWAFVRWAVGKGGPTLRARVAEAFERAIERVCDDAGTQGADALAAHGFLSADELTRLRRQAADEVLRPAATALCQISSLRPQKASGRMARELQG